MIESNIVKWVDLGDTMQLLDVYGKSKWVKFFNLIRVLISFKKFSIFFYIVLNCFSFIQLFMLNLTNIIDQDDSAIKILQSISNVIFIQDIITDETTYRVAVFINAALTVITILCIIYLIVSIKIGKFFMKIPINLLNLINVLLLNYFIGPIIQISILSTRCLANGYHVYLSSVCWQMPHLIFVIISVINLLFFSTLSIVLSIYYNEIGSINETKILARINCNYEIYANLSKISMFIFGYILKFYGTNNDIFKYIFQIFMLFNFTGFAFYVYKNVLFYDQRIYSVILYGWVFSTWFSLVIFLKTLLSIMDTSIFIILGWLILVGIVYNLEEFKEEHLLTDFNIFEAKTLKEIELFNLKLFNLLNMRSIKNQTLLTGIIEKFKEMTKANDELREKYTRLMDNKHLKKKFSSSTALSVLSMVYIIYDHHLEKSFLKNDILLNMSYFLVNKFKNLPYTIYLLSKIKAISHKHLYFKYLLMEEVSSYMINKLSKSNNKESIKHIQLGSVILYNIYIDLFKLKIFESCSNQIEYFDLLRNNVTTPKTTENFLKIGEDILNYRKEILRLWERIIELNPFNDEAFKDYQLYLRDIIQDDVLHRNEVKRYNNFKNSKMSERTNTYNSLFNPTSSIIMVDGYSSFGKILYTTPNFPQLYSFSGKEVLNMYIDDLVPQVMKDFHKEIIDNAIKYSNIHMIFNEQREFLLKSKTNSIHSISIYNKSIPNLSYGLIYIANITKNHENNYIIITDKEFKISGLTDVFSQGHNSAFQGFTIDKSVHQCNIGVILPDLLLQLEYKEETGFFSSSNEVDIKGVLYSVQPHRVLNDKVEKVIDRIKTNGKLIQNEEGRQNSLTEYDELIREINSRATNKHSVFYRIVTRAFVGGFKYYRIYVSNDMITMNETTNNNQNDMMSVKGRKKQGGQKEGKITSNKQISDKMNNSQKQIKIKLNHFGSNEEGAKLMMEGEPDKDLNQKDEYKKELEKEHDSGTGSSVNSSATKSSVDSASFNKLKNGILDKKEVSAIKLMRYLSFCFGIGTILLVFFASLFSKNKFQNINEFYKENLYFNHSKIAVSCVYLATLNFKLVKYNYYVDQKRCFTNCTDFYNNMLSTCISDIKKEKENSTYYYDQFRTILNSQKEIQLNLYEFDKKDVLTIDVESNLNLLVVYGLTLNHGLDTYFNKGVPDKSTYNSLDIVSQNILEQSLLYIDDNKISGYDDTSKATILNSSAFNPVNMILIIEAGLFCILIVAFIYLICSLFSLERYYLKKLIEFKNLPFEQYLKQLEEIKKKIKNDNGEEDEKFQNDLDMQDFGNVSKKSKEGSKEEGSTKKDKKKKKADKGKDKDDTDEGEKDNKKKRSRGKKKNVKNYREDKINVMSKYFLKWNIFFCGEVILILLLSVSYYLVVSLVDQSTQTNMTSFDYTTNMIEGIYKESFIIYLGLKTELAKYIDYEIEKKDALKALTNNQTAIIDGKTYLSADDINKMFYKMNLPVSIDNVPKIGHDLMPLVNVPDITVASPSIKTLNQLYNQNACTVLFPDTTSQTKCSAFWSSILTKGMEQAITQMSVVVTNVLDDFTSLNNGNKALEEVIQTDSEFNSYENFVEWYLFNGYMQTVSIFRDLEATNLTTIYSTYQSLMVGYMCFVVILFCLLLYFVYKSKSIFNNFMNFIGILPVKYLMENIDLYKEILKLEQHIYY